MVRQTFTLRQEMEHPARMAEMEVSISEYARISHVTVANTQRHQIRFELDRCTSVLKTRTKDSEEYALYRIES